MATDLKDALDAVGEFLLEHGEFVLRGHVAAAQSYIARSGSGPTPLPSAPIIHRYVHPIGDEPPRSWCGLLKDWPPGSLSLVRKNVNCVKCQEAWTAPGVAVNL
jgi:hypothetical protein